MTRFRDAANALPRPIQRLLGSVRHTILFRQGWRRSQRWSATTDEPAPLDPSNPLRAYFNNLRTGPGIWKWDHYFDIYHSHFQKFRGKEVHILEIGIYSGGSLAMWEDYFGPDCRVYGVDIEEACKAYENDRTKVFIGDQADRRFWRAFKEQVPRLDIVIDDGGHQSNQQIVSLEELLPQLRAGGVYICEDLHHFFPFCGFASYMNGFMQGLNASSSQSNDQDDKRRLVSTATALQSCIRSINVYPFVTVIERREAPIAEFVAPKHGSQWQPYLK